MNRLKTAPGFALIALLLSTSAWAAPATPPTTAAPGVASNTTPAPGDDTRAVTQAQFKELLRIFKGVIKRFDSIEARMAKLEKGAKSSTSSQSEEAVDLNALSTDAGALPVGAPPAGLQNKFHGQGAQGEPSFKVYFDLALISRPGIEDFSFDSFHQLVLFELLATPEIQFNFDLNPNPKYFELDYQITPSLQLRAGKIWIPFDDMAPHNIYGGRVNVSRLAPGAAFLPDIWTELGVGFKWQIIDSSKLATDFNFYIVNGFPDGGKDLRNPSTGTAGYPNLADVSIAKDNNRDKALGGRLHFLFFNRLGFGVSVYSGRWSSEKEDPKRLNMIGMDTMLRFGGTELRAGLAQIGMNLGYDIANRGGMYVEAGQKWGAKQQWKILARGGVVQLDDRVIDITDQRIVGASLLFKPNMIQYSLEYSRDLQELAKKTNYSFAAARIVMAF